EGVQTGKGDTARADHQRHEVQTHRVHDRDGEEEHHRRAMNGEELIVSVGSENRVLRSRQLQTNQGRLDSRREKHRESGKDVALRDCLVVDGSEPTPEAWPVAPGDVEEARVFQYTLRVKSTGTRVGRGDRCLV